MLLLLLLLLFVEYRNVVFFRDLSNNQISSIENGSFSSNHLLSDL